MIKKYQSLKILIIKMFTMSSLFSNACRRRGPHCLMAHSLIDVTSRAVWKLIFISFFTTRTRQTHLLIMLPMSSFYCDTVQCMYYSSTVLYGVQEGYATVVSSWARLYFMIFYVIVVVRMRTVQLTLVVMGISQLNKSCN